MRRGEDPRRARVRHQGDLAKTIIKRALASPLPIAWVTADSAYGQEWRLRRMLEEAGVDYVLAVPKSQHVHAISRIDFAFAQAPDDAWERHSCGAGAKGPRIYGWAAARLPAIDDFDGDQPTHDRWVLARRRLARPNEIAYYLAYAPARTTVTELVRIAGTRWAIEEAVQAAKNECGLDQYEVRRIPRHPKPPAAPGNPFRHSTAVRSDRPPPTARPPRRPPAGLRRRGLQASTPSSASTASSSRNAYRANTSASASHARASAPVARPPTVGHRN
ncbi:transposase [Streptomyces sp. NPDC059008]|uniref:IS701 family transposase n=1 Tax=Streptomyces sp. NPDC059008 TaxID=3346693 RepID=UPI0036B59885